MVSVLRQADFDAGESIVIRLVNSQTGAETVLYDGPEARAVLLAAFIGIKDAMANGYVEDLAREAYNPLPDDWYDRLDVVRASFYQLYFGIG